MIVGHKIVSKSVINSSLLQLPLYLCSLLWEDPIRKSIFIVLAYLMDFIHPCRLLRAHPVDDKLSHANHISIQSARITALCTHFALREYERPNTTTAVKWIILAKNDSSEPWPYFCAKQFGLWQNLWGCDCDGMINGLAFETAIYSFVTSDT